MPFLDAKIEKKFNNKMSSFRCNCDEDEVSIFGTSTCDEYKSGGDDSSCPKSLCKVATLEMIDSWMTHVR